MRRKLSTLLVLPVVLFGAVATVAHAQDLVRQTAPYKWLEPILPEDLPELDYPAWASELDKAKLESFRGRYKKSLLTLLKVRDGDPVEVALVRGTALAALGREDQALEALSQEQVKDDPRVQVLRAQILVDTGLPSKAIELLQAHLEKHPTSLEGRYLLGVAYEQIGDLVKARDSYGWFVAPQQNFLERWQKDREKAFDNAADVTTIGRAIDRWATLSGAYQKLPDLHQTLADLFVRVYDVIDRGHWPAYVAAAEYFLSHNDDVKAKKELAAALAANPNDARALNLIGRIALGEYDFDTADSAIESIRKVDPESVVADLLETRTLLRQRRPFEAAKPVERVLAQQPQNLEALGLHAAVYSLQLKDDRVAEAIKRIEQIDPDNATAYFEVAEELAAMRQYPRSAAMYKTAIERAPWWTAARNGLGLLYTQSGDEQLAHQVLDEAHAIDPYNLATTNYLRLLDTMAKYARLETEHFVLIYDESIDPLIPEYFAEFLESVHPEVAKAFDHEPLVKTYIEVFPTHDEFSVRTTGSPWIGTVGASTGRVIALVSPRKGEMTMGTFNWAQVLRHEYTHTVTLSATDNRIPHWMTEGLAVLEEHAPLRWEWVPMLYHAVTKDELFTMDNLTWGFVRPKKPTDRSLAYAQSFWVCKYIEETYGRDAILKMMAEFKQGRPQEDVFPSVLGRSVSEFTNEFFAWARRQVSTWGYDEQTSEKYKDLREQGEGLIKSRQFGEAVKVWEQIAQIRPVDALPHQRLAGLYLTKDVNQPDKAIEHLKVLHAVELKDNRYAKRIARVYRDTERFEEAEHYAMQAVYVDPYDLDAHQLLAEVYEKTGNEKGLERERRVIPVLEKWLERDRQRLQIETGQ
jgi:tetratricopeptide (TPR) repeat protein